MANEYIRTKTLKLKGIRGMYNLENRKDKLFAYVFAYLQVSKGKKGKDLEIHMRYTKYNQNTPCAE